MTLQQAQKIQEETISNLASYMAGFSGKKITTDIKKTLFSKLAAAYLPVVKIQLKRAQDKIISFEKKYKKNLSEFELQKESAKSKTGVKEHEDWVEWTHWDHVFSESLLKIKTLEDMIYKNDRSF